MVSSLCVLVLQTKEGTQFLHPSGRSQRRQPGRLRAVERRLGAEGAGCVPIQALSARPPFLLEVLVDAIADLPPHTTAGFSGFPPPFLIPSPLLFQGKCFLSASVLLILVWLAAAAEP